MSVVLCTSAIAAETATFTATTREAPETVLARAQRNLASADMQSARDGFAMALAMLDQNPSTDFTAIVEALVGFATSLTALHNYDAAIAPARRALTIVRSRGGLYAEAQRPILLLLVEAQSQTGRVEEAADDLGYLQRISSASAATDPARHAATLADIGIWQCRLGTFFAGRANIREAIERLESVGDETHLLNAHLGLAKCALHELSAQGIRTAAGVFEEYRGPFNQANAFDSARAKYRYRAAGNMRYEAERAVRDAAQLVTRSASFTAREKADTLLFAGDWFQLKGFTKTARSYYLKAATVPGASGGPDEALDKPVRVLYAIPPLALRAFGAARPAHSERFIVVEFTVRADGTVETPRVLERNVSKSMVDETLDALRVARYRPRVRDGALVASRKVILRQSFDDPREFTGSVAYSKEE